MLSIFGAGIFLIMIFFSAASFLQSVILNGRGQIVTAKVDRIVTDPAFPAGTDSGCRSCSHTHGLVFKTDDGKTLRGYPYGTSYDVHVGDTLPVVIDPKGQIDSRSPGEVQPIRDGVILLLAASLAYYICYVSGRAWKSRTTYSKAK
jgi:hypothetical protein